MTPTSIHSTCTCRFFHQGQSSCPDVTLFVIDDDSHAAGPFRLQQDGARMTFFYCLNGQARIDAQAADGEAFSEEIGKFDQISPIREMVSLEEVANPSRYGLARLVRLLYALSIDARLVFSSVTPFVHEPRELDLREANSTVRIDETPH